MSPVHEMPVAVSTSVPEVAVWSPFGVASSNTSVAGSEIVMPLYGVWPVLVNVAVNLTTLPGVVLATLALLTIVSWATVTVFVQRGSVLPTGQLLPRLTEVSALVRIMLPVSGFFTVTE